MSSDANDSPIDHLGKYYGPRVPHVEAEFGALSHVGLVRTNNEDHYAVVERYRSRRLVLSNIPVDQLVPTRETAFAMAVADGVGGASSGEIASRLALTTAWYWGGRETRWLMNVGESTDAIWDEQFQILGELLHDALKNYAHDRPETAGMGTTLTIAYVLANHLFTFHVGDSRAYLIRGSLILRLSQDHTLGEELTAAGAPADIAYRQRHVLTNVLGTGGAPVIVEWHHLQLLSGDLVLLCTDGLSDLVGDSEILAATQPPASPQTICDQLVQLALSRGGKDNTTVVVGKFTW